MKICPKCQRTLKNPNAWHYCGNNDIDTLFEGKKSEFILIFDALLLGIMDWENVAVSATKNCVVFVRNKTFLVVKPMTKVLHLKFYLNERQETPPIFKSEQWNNKFETSIRLEVVEDLTPTVIELVKKSYDIS